MNGTYGPAAQKVQQFIAALQESLTIPVTSMDERLTSTQANRILSHVRRAERKQKVDKMAAAILLQAYLDVRSGP
jgi:putative Holliday junction resolvase